MHLSGKTVLDFILLYYARRSDIMREAGSILENQELHMKNVLSFRKKTTQAELQREAMRIGKCERSFGK